LAIPTIAADFLGNSQVTPDEVAMKELERAVESVLVVKVKVHRDF